MEILNDFDDFRLILECSHPQKQVFNSFVLTSCPSICITRSNILIRARSRLKLVTILSLVVYKPVVSLKKL